MEETGLVPASSYQASHDIPNDIYQPLLSIAQRGYDATNVKQWYLMILQHLPHIGQEHGQTIYRLATPEPDDSSAFFDPKTHFYSGDHADSSTGPVGSYEDHVSPFTDPSAWSTSPAFEAVQETAYGPAHEQQDQMQSLVGPQQSQTAVSAAFENRAHTYPSARLATYWTPDGSPFQKQIHIPSTEPSQLLYPSPHKRSQSLLSSADWNSLNTSASNFDVNALAAASNEHIPDQPVPSQWFGPEDFAMTDIVPATSSSAPYQHTISNTSMPLLIPCEPTTNANYSSNSPLTPTTKYGLTQLSSGLYTSAYFPTIPIVSSKKRRRVFQRAVKKSTEPLQHQRQQSV